MLRTLLALVAALHVLATPARAAPDDIVIVIANEAYDGNVPKVEYAKRDGAAMARFAREVLGLDSSRIAIVENATSGQLEDWFGRGGTIGPKLARLPIRKTSTIYAFYSGHGLPAKRSEAIGFEPFLLPVDTEPDAAGRRGLAVADMRAALLALQRQKAPEGRVVLLLEACFSGSSSAGRIVPDTSFRISAKAIRDAEPRLVELSAADNEQEASWDRERRHGIFTEAAMLGLYGAADANGDGHVTAAELAAFVGPRVERRVAQLFPNPRRYQTPMLTTTEPDARLASLSARTPAWDAALKSEEGGFCAAYAASRDVTAIERFLATCTYCDARCRATLDDRARIVREEEARCAGETRVLDGLKARKAGKAEVEAFARTATCGRVRAAAEGLVAAASAPSPVASGAIWTGLRPMDPSPLLSPSPSAVVPPGTAPGSLVRSWQAHLYGVSGVALFPDRPWAVSASDDEHLKVWDLATGRELRTFAGHTGAVSGVAVSPNGKWLVSSSWDRTLKLWDVATGRELRTLVGHKDWVLTVVRSPDGQWLASGSLDKTIKLWTAATGQELRTLTGHSGAVSTIAVSTDGRWLASGSSDATIKIWDVATGQDVRTLAGHEQGVRAVAFSPDGRWLISGSDDKTLRHWDLATGRELRTLEGHKGVVWAVSVSPDGQWIVSGGLDSTVQVWSASTGRHLRTLAGHSNYATSVSVSQDGRWILSAGCEEYNKKSYNCTRGDIKIWAMP
ncbi:MAG TPA: caspase family protein [Hyphomicrobiaceae bacterium]|nr:caspase family protein [Hyphomicrobiaceae bacterium]